jgi:glycerol-3-phosphate cytidylyltransferase-like family protein
MKRQDAEQLVKQNGGVCKSSVTKDLTYLVTNDTTSGSSKNVKAAKLGIPVIDENQRLEMIKYLKPVDEAYIGYDGDMFKIVEEIQPDIIAIGSDQNHDIAKLQEQLDKRGIKAVAKRVKEYRTGELDSTCKIINRIKHSELEEKNLDCSNVINDD